MYTGVLPSHSGLEGCTTYGRKGRSTDDSTSRDGPDRKSLNKKVNLYVKFRPSTLGDPRGNHRKETKRTGRWDNYVDPLHRRRIKPILPRMFFTSVQTIWSNTEEFLVLGSSMNNICSVTRLVDQVGYSIILLSPIIKGSLQGGSLHL